MQFNFTDEQKLIRDTVFSALQEMGDRNRIYDVIEKDGYDREAWELLCKELMLGGTSFAEEYGGAGLSFVELAIVQEALGQFLIPTPFFASIVMSGYALDLCGSQAQKQAYLPALIAGEKIATLAYLDTSGHFSADAYAAELSQTGTLNGQAIMVQYVQFADQIIVLCQTDEGPKLVLVEAGQEGVEITPKTAMDLTRPVGDVRFENVAIAPENIMPAQADDIETLFDYARIMLAVEQMGAAEGVMNLTNAYAKDRVQFGRAIGSFQAVKHRLADMMVLLEAAKSAAWYAVCTAIEDEAELSVAASTASIVCARAFSKNASHGIQLHGGMGFTWECMAHLFFKRARTSSHILGAPELHREKLADYVFSSNRF